MSRDPDHRVYADLVGSVLDARIDPATARFDAELDRALEAGQLAPETARRLRFWQRAAMQALTDHARHVLPTVLGALDASREDTREQAIALLGSLREADEIDNRAARGVAVTTEVVDLRDTPERASTMPAPGPSRVGESRRMMVAGLIYAPDYRSQQR